MTYRGEVEDGAGWGGLVPSKTELREERMQIEITLLRAEKKDLVKQRDDLVQDNLAMISEIERLKAELDTIGQMIGSAIDVAVFKQVKRERRGQTAKNGRGD